MRFVLIKEKGDKYYFIWTVHHILVDGWCFPIILNEVMSIYGFLISNEQIKLKTRRPYRDYISWIAKQDQGKAKKYWQQELLGIKPSKIGN